MALIKRRRTFCKGVDTLMSELHIIKCQNCGKVLCEASGEVKKICPKCKAVTHVVVTSLGIYSIAGIDFGSGTDKTAFNKI